jgi:hypothetical protein
MPGPTLNSLGILRGALAQVQIAPWVAAGGSGSLVDLGGLRAIKIGGGNKVHLVQVDNCQWAIDAFNTEQSIDVGVTLVEADLKNFARASGDVDSSVAVSAGISATYPIGQIAGVNFWQIVLTVAGLAIKIGADTYTKWTMTLWRAIIEGKRALDLSKDKDGTNPVTVHGLYDSTVTASTTVGNVGKLVFSVS